MKRNFINSLTGFKSLCLCATQDHQGQTNLALMSQVIHVGASPPLIGVLFRPHVVPRHSLENIENTGLFSLNHVNEGIYQQAHQVSARYAREESEFSATGLTPVFDGRLKVPYVRESTIRLGLTFKERHNILTNATILVIGEIKEVFVPAKLVGEDGFVDLEQAGSLTVSGLDSYHRTERIARLSYAKPNKPIEKLS
ncbi:MAG: flavin reductase, partial [Bacteroidota bacterium]